MPLQKYIVGKSDNSVVSRYVGKGVRPNHLMGAWSVEYSTSHYKVMESTKERSVGYKFRKRKDVD